MIAGLVLLSCRSYWWLCSTVSRVDAAIVLGGEGTVVDLVAGALMFALKV